MASTNPNQNPTLLPDQDVINYASTTPSAHNWTAAYTNNTGASQTVTANIPMGALETTRSFTATAIGSTTGQTASGSAGINDTLTVPAGSGITYAISSTYTLTSPKTYGSNTNKASFAVTSGQTYKRWQVVNVGYANAGTQQLFPNQLRTARDTVALFDQLLVRGTDVSEMNDLYDWMENSTTDTSFLSLRKAAYGLGGLATVSTALDYTARPEDFFILETGNSKTITFPAPALAPGRILWVRATGTTNVIAPGNLNGAAGATLAATQSKTFGFISNGSTWLTLAVQS